MESQYNMSPESARCRTCLSAGRVLRAVHNYADVFWRVVGPINLLNIQQMLICWECEALLRSVVRFQNKVHAVNSVLGQKDQASLSNLVVTVLAPISNKSEIEIKQDNRIIQNNSHLFVDQEYHYIDDPFNITEKPSVSEIKSEIDSDEFRNDETIFVKTEDSEFVEPKAKDRAKELKKTSEVESKIDLKSMPKKTLAKPRYNFVKTTGNTDEKDMYSRVKINAIELAECIVKERDSLFFKRRKKKCEECLFECRGKLHLQRHMNRHMKSAGNYVCDVCKIRFSKKQLLAKHTQSHHYKLVCSVCSYECYTKGHMLWHYRKYHDTSYQCCKCGLKFLRRSDFTEHYKRMHERLICDHCGTQFKMRYMMIKHMRKRHLSIKCNICGTCYSSRYGLKVHRLRLHSSEGAAAAYCVECDMQFQNEFKYKNHLKTGARHKPRIKRFPCEHCDKMFSKACDLRAHHNMVHLKICRFRCDDCGQRFGRKCNLLEHRRVRHERRSPSRDKVCQICGRGFTTKQSLNRHMLIHTGERPYVCPHCAASFNQRSAMKTHCRNVHKEQLT